MRVLHTADWHLGKRLENEDRTEEYQFFLDNLLQIIDNERIDILLISGDIFDSGAPSNTALELYYDFLAKLRSSSCYAVVVTGGNHDSVSTLNAPKAILHALNVTVVGGVSDRLEDEVVWIKNPDGQLVLGVAAVPFLRDKDVRTSLIGESGSDRDARVINGIAGHYEDLVPFFKDAEVPVMAMGHLYAAGATPSDSEREILVGGLGQMPASRFPDLFQYVALGHLHRPQIVGGKETIRYSGSPIALSFSERKDKKQILILEWENGVLKKIIPFPLIGGRKLKRMSGTLEEVKAQLTNNTLDVECHFKDWVEIRLQVDRYLPDAEAQLNAVVAENPSIDKLFVRQEKTFTEASLAEQTSRALQLNSLQPKMVFEKLCQSKQMDEAQTKEMSEMFDKALIMMNESKN